MSGPECEHIVGGGGGLLSLMQRCSTVFLNGKRLHCASEEYSPCKDSEQTTYHTTTSVPVLSSYVSDHADSPRISANADLSTILKCLASDKKSIK